MQKTNFSLLNLFFLYYLKNKLKKHWKFKLKQWYSQNAAGALLCLI